MKVLIIEDDRTLAKNLKQVLVKAGFAVDTANTRENGLAETEINEYDCIVLDINLPDGSGFDLLDDLRNWKQNPGHYCNGQRASGRSYQRLKHRRR